MAAEQPQEPLPHASEEAAEISRIMEGEACGEVRGPELEQGTPVVDVSLYWSLFDMIFTFLRLLKPVVVGCVLTMVSLPDLEAG